MKIGNAHFMHLQCSKMAADCKMLERWKILPFLLGIVVEENKTSKDASTTCSLSQHRTADIHGSAQNHVVRFREITIVLRTEQLKGVEEVHFAPHTTLSCMDKASRKAYYANCLNRVSN